MAANGIRKTVVAGGVRIPFAKMGTKLAGFNLLEMMTLAAEATVMKFGLKGERMGEVALGTTFFHPNFWNIARDVVFKSSLSPLSPAMGIQRACGTSLEASIALANKIALGQIECGIAGGVESMSQIALFLRPELALRIVKNTKARSLGEKLKIWQGLRVKDLFPTTAPGTELSTKKSMGQHCEIMAKTWKVGREEQDEIALKSHLNAAAAYKRGFYGDLVAPVPDLLADNCMREDTTLEKLSKLKPAFDSSPAGTLTAGNSSPLTDGAAAVFLTSEDYAQKRNLQVMAFIRDFETAAVDIQTEGLLMAPVFALPRMLARQGLKLQDFDFYEIHEAFAAQVLCNLKAWESDQFCRERLGLPGALGPIDRSKLNVAGGSIALGHPFGATGARLVATAAKLLNEKGSGRALISICTGGGMGTVMILEK